MRLLSSLTISTSIAIARAMGRCVVAVARWAAGALNRPTSLSHTCGSSVLVHGGMWATATISWPCAAPSTMARSIGSFSDIGSAYCHDNNHRMLPIVGLSRLYATFAIAIRTAQLRVLTTRSSSFSEWRMGCEMNTTVESAFSLVVERLSSGLNHGEEPDFFGYIL